MALRLPSQVPAPADVLVLPHPQPGNTHVQESSVGTLFAVPHDVFATALTNAKLCWFSAGIIVQELSESRGGRPVLSVLTSLLVSVDVKLY